MLAPSATIATEAHVASVNSIASLEKSTAASVAELKALIANLTAIVTSLQSDVDKIKNPKKP